MVRRVRAAVALAGFILVLSGCIGPGNPADATGTGGTTAGGIVETVRPLPSGVPVDPHLGSIIGQVYNTDNVTIRGANVLLVGTSNFTKTDSLGRFGLVGITPGTYTLHVDADKYRFLEEPVAVEAGKVHDLVIRLEFLKDETIGFREHFHDLWGKDTVKTLFEGPVGFPGSQASGGDDASNLYCLWGGGGGSSDGTTTSGMQSDAPADDEPPTKPTSGPCYDVPIRLETGALVLPGTKELRFTATWIESASVPHVTIRATNATSKSGKGNTIGVDGSSATAFGYHELIMDSGATRTLTLNQSDGQDHGHAHYTSWRFALHADTQVGGQWVQSPDIIRKECGDFMIKIEAVKGVVPPDRPHKHYWTNGSKIVVPEFQYRLANTGDMNRNPASSGDYGYGPAVALPPGVMVPPGTTRINLSLAYGSGLPSDAMWTHKAVAFRTSRSDPQYATLEDLLTPQPSVKPTATGLTRYSFQIDSANETDSFYDCVDIDYGVVVLTSCATAWLLLLANEGAEDQPTMTNECGYGCGTDYQKFGTTFKFNLEFINENWADDFKAGRI